MNVQPWAMYTPQAYQPYPLAGIPGGFAPGIGGGPLAQQSLISHWLGGLAGFPGQGLGPQFGYPQQFSQFGYPQQLGSHGGFLPFHAVPGIIPGVQGGFQAGQFPLQGLTPFGHGVGLPGQGLWGQFGYPQQIGQGLGFGGQFGYPQQIGQGLGSLGGLLPFYAAPMITPGPWSGSQPYLGGQWTPHGLMGNLLSGLAGHAGQHIGGLPPFQTVPGMAAVA